MASSGIRTPRSVSDATRFTPTTPHAASKGVPASSSSSTANASATASAASSTSRSAAGSSRFSPGAPGRGPSRPSPPSSGGILTETPEQRVARLRAAHLAAKNAKVSQMDRIVDRARGFFDHAHRITTMGLIGLTAVATVVTAYAAVDMMAHNRKRKAEFIEAQRRMHADSLEAARLAYMRGDATEEQIALVEDANARGNTASIFSSMPSVISSPAPVKPPTDPAADVVDEEKSSTGSGSGWGWGFLGGNLKAEDGPIDPARATAAIAASVEEKARAAFEKEKENQRKGGPLDQVGNNPNEVGGNSSSEKPKRGWW